MTDTTHTTRRNVLTAGPAIVAAALPTAVLASSESALDRAKRHVDELSAVLAELDGEWMAIVYPAYRKAILSQARPRDEPITPD